MEKFFVVFCQVFVNRIDTKKSNIAAGSSQC